MRTLDEDDTDKQLQRAVPWVSDPQDREQRDNETRRLEEDVLEAAKRLERESARLPPQPPADPQTAVGFRLTEPSLRGGAEPRRRDVLGTIPRRWAAPRRPARGPAAASVVSQFRATFPGA